MVQQVKTLVTRPNELSSISGIYRLEREQMPAGVLWPSVCSARPPAHLCLCACTREGILVNTHIHGGWRINKNVIKNKKNK